MLSDNTDTTIINKLYDYILEKPLKAIELLACTGGNSNKTGDCVVKLGKEICRETGDAELCEMVEKAEIVNEASKVLIGNEPTVTPQIDITTPLNNLVNEFANIDCSQLSEAQKTDLVNRLNALEMAFSEQGRRHEFNTMIKKLSCDVVAEFKCNDSQMAANYPLSAGDKFEVNPHCKPKFLTVWKKPLAIGGVTGLGAGIIWHKIARGSITSAVLVGIFAGAGTTYYLKRKQV